MTDMLTRLNGWLADRHAKLTGDIRGGLPTVGSLFDGLAEKWERENDEQHRRVKALDATDEGMADLVAVSAP